MSEEVRLEERVGKEGNHRGDASEVVSVGEWLVTSLIMAIPIVNIVMVFVWAFGGGAKKSKANFFKAAIIMMIISIILSFLLFSSLMSFFSEFSQGY